MTMVMNGIDRIDEHAHLLEGKAVGLITAPTGLDRHFRSTIDILNEQFQLKALFSPEHGVRGDIQAGVKIPTYQDERTGIMVYSLYAGGHRPTQEMMDQVDVIAMDVQDIGSRYYTFISTMSKVMEECARCNKPFVLLDRVNPINGMDVEGRILDPAYKSFVGLHPIPARHGMTMGELALYFNDQFGIGCQLEVVPVSGWTRGMYFDECELPWVSPSYNIPSLDAAILYNGTCLIEGTNLSEGRGTVKPFEMIGAPWLDADRLAGAMNAYELPGVWFRPAYFTPFFSKHADELCKGVQVHLTDRNTLNAVEMGVYLLKEVQRQSGDHFQWISHGKGRYFIDLLCGSDELRTEKMPVEQLLLNWSAQSGVFKEKRQPYLLY